VGETARASDGIPLMDALFKTASKVAKHNVLCYINTDIALPSSWWKAMQAILPWALAQEVRKHKK
jgi:hypothetical protein